MNATLLRSVAVSVLLFGATWLAGCAGVDDPNPEASLDFKGTGDGVHSEQGSCDDEGRLQGSGEVKDGSVELRITDPDGTEVFRREFKGSISLAGEEIQGDPGTWKLEAERNGDDLVGDEFDGEYQFQLNC